MSFFKQSGPKRGPFLGNSPHTGAAHLPGVPVTQSFKPRPTGTSNKVTLRKPTARGGHVPMVYKVPLYGGAALGATALGKGWFGTDARQTPSPVPSPWNEDMWNGIRDFLPVLGSMFSGGAGQGQVSRDIVPAHYDAYGRLNPTQMKTASHTPTEIPAYAVELSDFIKHLRESDNMCKQAGFGQRLMQRLGQGTASAAARFPRTSAFLSRPTPRFIGSALKSSILPNRAWNMRNSAGRAKLRRDGIKPWAAGLGAAPMVMSAGKTVHDMVRGAADPYYDSDSVFSNIFWGHGQAAKGLWEAGKLAPKAIGATARGLASGWNWMWPGLKRSIMGNDPVGPRPVKPHNADVPPGEIGEPNPDA